MTKTVLRQPNRSLSRKLSRVAKFSLARTNKAFRLKRLAHKHPSQCRRRRAAVEKVSSSANQIMTSFDLTGCLVILIITLIKMTKK